MRLRNFIVKALNYNDGLPQFNDEARKLNGEPPKLNDEPLGLDADARKLIG